VRAVNLQPAKESSSPRPSRGEAIAGPRPLSQSDEIASTACCKGLIYE
jgi:hypothetical protein